MGTLEPNIPKPGYQKRWAKQALDLVVRDPLNFATYILIIGIYGFAVTISVTSISSMIFGNSIQENIKYLSMIGGVFSIFPFGLIFISFFYVDDRSMPNIRQSMKNTIPFLKVSIFYVSFILLLTYFLGSSVSKETTTTSGSAADMDGLTILAQGIVLSVIIGIQFISIAVLSLRGIGFFSWGLVYGFEAGPSTTKLFKDKTDKKIPKINTFLERCAVGVLVIMLFTPIISIFILYYFIAYLYVASREIVGGIGENSPAKASSGKLVKTLN